jgi:hypothetical protein
MRVCLGALLVGALFLSGCGAGLFASSGGGVDVFRYEQARVPIGVAYHYIKSNMDGSTPERVSLYVASRDTIETFKFRDPNPTFAAHVIATMDWTRFSATRLESKQMTRGGNERAIATAAYEPAQHSLSIQLKNAPSESIPITVLPFHIYSFELASLSMALRHLTTPEGTMTIGIAGPTYADKGPVFEYRGEATLAFTKNEDYEGKPCRKYRFDGPGLKNHGGWVWLDKTEGHIIALEIAQPNHPDFASFKMKLMFTDTMNQNEWKDFMKSRLEPGAK